MWSSAKSNSSRQKIKGILLNVQIAEDLGTAKTIVTSNRDASNAQVTIRQAFVTVRKM
jgi:hypothetical protein